MPPAQAEPARTMLETGGEHAGVARLGPACGSGRWSQVVVGATGRLVQMTKTSRVSGRWGHMLWWPWSPRKMPMRWRQLYRQLYNDKKGKPDGLPHGPNHDLS
jgi:hypothetical protein